MLTTMEEEVDELWTSRVTRTPMTRPARGLDKTVLSLKMSPAALPGQDEHTSMYIKTIAVESEWKEYKSRSLWVIVTPTCGFR